MQLPLDVLDYIFGLLKWHPESLVACSRAHPVFSRAVERHLYHHIIIRDEKTDSHAHTLEPSYLAKLLAETPRIANYVRVLDIEFDFHQNRPRSKCPLEATALILPLLPMLKSITLTNWYDSISWQEALSKSFRTAVEKCLLLPTLQEIHVHDLGFPLSLLDNHPNLHCFSLSGPPKIPDSPADDVRHKLKSLSFDRIDGSDLAFFSAWAKRHIVRLQSLKCCYLEPILSEFLEICSDTLISLDFTLHHPSYQTTYCFHIGDVLRYESNPEAPSIDLSSLPYLQHITIRIMVDFDDLDDLPEKYFTCLPAAVKIVKTASSLRHLTINIRFPFGIPYLSYLNFPILTYSLAELSASCPLIDLYIDSATPTPDSKILSLFDDYKGLIPKGVLVIHANETAPTNFTM